MTLPTSTNHLARFSFISACLTVVSFCIGLAPFLPMTAPVCYPTAVVLGLVALVTGSISLRQVRASGEKGRGLALIGIWMGVFSILAVICATTLTVLVVYFGWDYLQANWPQFTP